MRSIAAVLILLSLPQDDARVQELIQQLEDDNFDVRDRAEKALVAAGDAALGPLKKAIADAQARKDGGELLLRSTSALRQIELASKARKVYQDPKTVTLRVRDEELGKVLDEVSRQTGAKIDASTVDTRDKVSLDADGAPLFKVLDDLCRGRDERSFDYRDDGIVKFARDRHVPFPSQYEGPFRVRVLKMRLERSTDFKERKAVLHLTLGADYERYLKPSRKVAIEITRATDDQGTTLEARAGTGPEDEELLAWRRVIRVVPGGAATTPDTGQAFFVRGLAPRAMRVTLTGTAKFSFPLDLRDVVFDKVETGETREAGDFAIKLERVVARRSWTVSIKRARGKEEAGPADVDARLDKESGVAVDEDGNEHKGTFSPSLDREFSVVIGPGGAVQESGGGGSFQLTFPGLGVKKIKQLKFRFIDSTFVKSMPFKFENLELP